MRYLTTPVPVALGDLTPVAVSLGNVTLGGLWPEYAGPYEVTPDFAGVVLATDSLNMTDDVTVHPIPVQKTENLGGGYTVVIGG